MLLDLALRELRALEGMGDPLVFDDWIFGFTPSKSPRKRSRHG
ncbi:MAG: hypothetical protein ACYCWW_09710 [Deltaproteobacteria bacterium]